MRISMTWFGRLFGAHIVALSEPYSDNEGWSYIFGDATKFEIRTFPTAEDAHSSYDTTLMGLRVSSPEVPIKLINLGIEQTRAIVQAEISYREIIETHLF